MASPPRLLVRIDGELVPEDEARTIWERFSAHMEANKGDLAGFAAAMSMSSARPGLEGGRPVLLLSRTLPQAPYGPPQNAPNPGDRGGSGPPRGEGGAPGGARRKRRR